MRTVYYSKSPIEPIAIISKLMVSIAIVNGKQDFVVRTI